MALTKTNFINYTKCSRYASLEEIKRDKLCDEMSLEEYMKESENAKYKEIIFSMFRENEDGSLIDTTVKVDKKLSALMECYKDVEILAGHLSESLFASPCKYSIDTYNQESFSFQKNGIKYICFVDIYNEKDDVINIVEVKSTTSKKYKDLTYRVGKDKFPLFIFDNGFYRLSNDPGMSEDYQSRINKLLDRYDSAGKYIYDLAVQRYFIEGYLNENNVNKEVHYYLAVLNNEYTYDGKMENGNRIYDKDSSGNEIIDFFNMDEITKLYMSIIDDERINLEHYIFDGSAYPCKVGVYCALNENTECIYKDLCFKNVPEKNASFNYKRFTNFNVNGIKYGKYDLINEGILKLDDVPREWLKSENHKIQRDCLEENKVYINKEKILSGLNSLEYPIYHLDFETFQSPLPRFKGEHPYSQSAFEFSLHVERAPGVCDKERDNFVFLASSDLDERLELVKSLVSHIPILTTGGTMLAQNVTFERNRLKELASIFPEYKKELLAIRDAGRDLLDIIDTNKELYKSLGFNEIESSTMNYYNNAQSGSFSIKKTLPLFTNLSYKDLEVQNGVEAQIEYSRFSKLSKEELDNVRESLIEYCKQDTWAMVEILRGLRRLVND